MDVRNCLEEHLGIRTESPPFMCYNVVEGKGSSNDYEGLAMKSHGKMSMGVVCWVSLVVVGAVIGAS
jgi:hypothetical protein